MDANPTSAIMPPADETPQTWLRRHGLTAAIFAVIVGVVYYRTGFRINPLDVLLAAGGLTLIIFLHELGHFLAAKACGVRVETFAIGFGPALPFCSYRWGETEYRLAMIPLGGYVKMLGQEDGVVDEDGDTDPRSFKNQSVGERMLIISAGVVMNLILGCVLFVVVYLHGLEEVPGNIASMEPAGAAWKQNIHSGSDVLRIGRRENPWFEDIRPLVWFTDTGESIPLVVGYKGTKTELQIEPQRDEGVPYPILGIRAPESLTVAGRRPDDKQVRPGSAASKASNGGFQPGDQIVAMTDPDDADRAVTPLTPKADDPPLDVLVLHKRMARLAGEGVVVHVRRKGEPADAPPTAVTVPGQFRRSTGYRMRMGEVVATRRGSPADAAGVRAGDQITAVEVAAGDGKSVLYAAAPLPEAKPGQTVKPLDPLRLPDELNRWADTAAGTKTVRLTVLRDAEHTRKPLTVEVGWDAVGRFDLTPPTNANAPLAVNGLGLAYHVLAVVEAEGKSGLQAGDAVTAVRFASVEPDGSESSGTWQDIKPTQWAYVDYVLQQVSPHRAEVRVSRGGGTADVTLAAADDPTWPADERGILFQDERRMLTANSVGEALTLGFHRTVRSIQTIYMNLYGIISGRVSVKTLSGPITLARVSYLLAGESTWKLLLMLAIISINLAVVNFLPIPVLDGGHMMFLLYEGVRRKPAPESVQAALTYAGLGVIGLMMVFVVGKDIWMLFAA